MKTFIVLALVAIVAALAFAGWFMLNQTKPCNDPAKHRSRMAYALALRVGLSVALFIIILLGWLLGWITPTGLPIAS